MSIVRPACDADNLPLDGSKGTTWEEGTARDLDVTAFLLFKRAVVFYFTLFMVLSDSEAQFSLIAHIQNFSKQKKILNMYLLETH